MRALFFIVFFLLAPLTYAQPDESIDNIDLVRYQAKPLSESDGRLLRRFDVDEDRFRDEIHIVHKNARKIPYPGLYPEIIIADGYMELRLVTVYRGDAWIFFEHVEVLVDDEKFEYTVDPNRQAVSGGVVERARTWMNEYHLDMLNKVVLSDRVVEYRLSGDYYVDRRLSRGDIRVIQDTFDLINALIAD